MSLRIPLLGNLAVPAAGFTALREVLVQKAAHMTGYHISIFFQREVAGVQQVELQILKVPLVRMRTVSRKDVVVFSPNDESWRLIFAEIFLPAGIQRNVALIVIEKRELNCRIALATQMPMIDIPVVRADRL